MSIYGNMLRICAQAFTVAGVLLTAPGSLGQGQTPGQDPGFEVAEIRFGIIEPPVVAQRDITVGFPPSPRDSTSLPLEASGVAWLDGQLLIVSDRHDHSLFTCPVNLQTMEIGPPRQQAIVENVQELLFDMESVASLRHPDGTWTVYVMSSLSNEPSGDPLPKRQHLARLRFSDPDALAGTRPVVLSASAVREVLEKSHFEIAGVEPYRTYFAEASGEDKNTVRWGNVEGTTLTYNGQNMLCGMRNPLYQNQAIVFVLSNLDRAVSDRNPHAMSVTDLFLLDLDGRGITGMDWDNVTNGYLISAARSNGPWLNKDQPFPPTFLDSALYWWSGHKQDHPILFAKAPDMTIEGICRLGMTDYIAVVSDEADKSESRTESQSVVTILYFTGLTSSPMP